MIPLYILGFLLRYGPQHGYQIKKLLTEQMSDFTNIKLPTIYYHLEKMEAAGLITAQNVKEGVRPEKRVYCISEPGKEQFSALLRQTLDMHYRPAFEVDAAFFFADAVDDGDFLQALERHSFSMERALEHIRLHEGETLSLLPTSMQPYAHAIFEHHELHIAAELTWAKNTIRRLKEDKSHDETENH